MWRGPELPGRAPGATVGGSRERKEAGRAGRRRGRQATLGPAAGSVRERCVSVGLAASAEGGDSCGEPEGSGSAEGGAGSEGVRTGASLSRSLVRGRRRRSSAPSSAPRKRGRHCRNMDPNWLNSWKEATNAPQPDCGLQFLGSLLSDGIGPQISPGGGNAGGPEALAADGTGKGKGKAKKSGSKPKQPNFSVSEDLALVSCWLNVSTDAVTSTGQRKASFWRCIEAAYNSKKGDGYPSRSLRSLEGRWDFIKEQVTKFAAYHRQVLLQNRSGHSESDNTAAALTLYNSIEARPFAVPHCWEVLKNEAKWIDLQERRQQGNMAGDADDGLEQPEERSNSVQEADGSSGIKRPLGRDGTKAARKRAALDSGTQSNSDYVSRISEMSIQKLDFWKESDANVNNRLDKLVEIEERKLSFEERRLELKEKRDAERIAMERAKEDERIMAIDLETCNPGQKQMYARMKQAILARWEAGN